MAASLRTTPASIKVKSRIPEVSAADYKVTGPIQTIPEGKPVIYFVSYDNAQSASDKGGQLQTGPRFKAAIDVLKERKCPTTVVLTSELQLHNVVYKKTVAGKEEKLAQAEAEEELNRWVDWFKSENKEALEGTRVLTWKELRSQPEVKENLPARSRLIAAETKAGSPFYLAMKKSAKSDVPLEIALAYQREEFETMAALGKTHVVYPKPTYAFVFFFKNENFAKIVMPAFVPYTINKKNSNTEHNMHKRKASQTHIALRMLYSAIENALASSEIPTESKKNFAQDLCLLLSLGGHIDPKTAATIFNSPDSRLSQHHAGLYGHSRGHGQRGSLTPPHSPEGTKMPAPFVP